MILTAWGPRSGSAGHSGARLPFQTVVDIRVLSLHLLPGLWALTESGTQDDESSVPLEELSIPLGRHFTSTESTEQAAEFRGEDWNTVGADRGGQGGPGEDHVPSSAPCPLLGAYTAQQVQNELVRRQPSPAAHPPSHTLYLYKLLPHRRLVGLHSADERASIHTGEGDVGVTWLSGASQD